MRKDRLTILAEQYGKEHAMMVMGALCANGINLRTPATTWDQEKVQSAFESIGREFQLDPTEEEKIQMDENFTTVKQMTNYKAMKMLFSTAAKLKHPNEQQLRVLVDLQQKLNETGPLGYIMEGEKVNG